jgi:protein phosphatase
VALFLFALVGVLGGAAGFTYWFNQATYYVSTDGAKVAIYEGRPGGFLWFHPHLVDLTSLDVENVLPANIPLLRSGMLESSYDDATHVVTNLANEQSILGITTTTNVTGNALPPIARHPGPSGTT